MAQGGAEETRLALAIGGIAFEDDRVPLQAWATLKPKTPLGSLPVATIQGRKIVQSKAILRYVGKLTGLYPDEPFQALLVDQVVDTVLDFHHTLFTYMGGDQERLRAARNRAMTEDAKRYWGGCERMLEDISDDGPYVLGEQLSIADLAIANMYLILRVGFLDFLSPKGLNGYPRMLKVFQSVMQIPEVVEWQKKKPCSNMD